MRFTEDSTLFLLILWIVAFAGLIGSAGYLIMVLVAVRRFRNSRPPRAEAQPEAETQRLPGVTLLKPVHGDEIRLEQNLESFFQQDYPEFEIIFGARYSNDPALAIVERLRKRYPDVAVKVVLSGDPDLPSAKICSLIKMVDQSRYDLLVISDSDVLVGRDYITEVTRPLHDPNIGLVTCLYRGIPTGAFWSRLEAMGMSVEMTSGVLVADMLEGMKFALGPTMAIQRDALEKIGGVGVLGDYHSDDFVLGKLVHEAGYRVVISHYLVDHIVLNHTMMRSMQHQARWLRSARFAREWGHIGTGITFAVPFGILALAAGLASGHTTLGIALFGLAVLNRLIQSIAVGWFVVRDADCLRFCWLYPVRDLVGFLLWMSSFTGRTILWRGERYRLVGGGRIVPCQPRTAPQLPEISVPDPR
jgi:ceramide glucosyltransferase